MFVFKDTATTSISPLALHDALPIYSPDQPNRPKRESDSLLNGPQMDTTKAGVVASQDQVDDLLDSLGF